MTTTEMTKKTKTKGEVATYQGAWGTENVRSETIRIPKILLMQGPSKLVAEEKAQMGDFVDSLTSKVIGSGRETTAKAIQIMPLMLFESWIETLVSGNKYLTTYPLTEQNAAQQIEFTTEDGEPAKRWRALNYYVLRYDEVDDPAAIPYVISFRSTSYNTGRDLATHFAKCRKAGAAPAATVFDLTATKRQNDKGTFFAWAVSPAEKTKVKDTQLKTAFEWYKTLTTAAATVQVDNSDLETETATGPEVDHRAGEVKDTDEF